MSGKQLSLDSRMDLVQRLVTDRENGSQIDESAENESDVEETSSGIDGMGHKRWIDGLIFLKLKKFFFWFAENSPSYGDDIPAKNVNFNSERAEQSANH